ncbi:WXG100 family type VII secretion target [Streptococcus plurextorum]|uniref:WXG100 family type VII secretion target n=1 Tax=Streptococcus plurextorum TaxID=456876 RepID=UPI0004076A66|nr:WXG100 family type VII secretion target [Streptococcus plurextorum]
MADLKIKYADLEKAIQLSNDIHSELKTSYQTASDLKKYLASAKWQGMTKDAFEAYLALMTQYHKDLIAIMADHAKAVKGLKQSIDDYNNSSEVRSITGL